jgi:hypothetical protein
MVGGNERQKQRSAGYRGKRLYQERPDEVKERLSEEKRKRTKMNEFVADDEKRIPFVSPPNPK